MTYKKDYVETLEKHTAAMRDMNERVVEENRRLREENERLRLIIGERETGLFVDFCYNKVWEYYDWFRNE